MPKIQTGPDTHIITDTPSCPLCALGANVYRRKEPADLFEGSCERCGDVAITSAAVDEARKDNGLHLISAWLRRRSAHIPTEVIKKEPVERILKDTPEYTVLEKIDLTLVEIERMIDVPGQRSTFDYVNDYPLVYAKKSNEAIFYIRGLADQGYIKEDSGSSRMTVRGYQRLSEIQRASRQSAFVFVAMWFDVSMNAIYDRAIKPAIQQAGYKAVRIDRQEHANKIDDEIIGTIRGSRFMVADFTGQRAGVYFEAGMMLGLGRTVVWMCKKDELKHVHFDTRQYNFIDYKDAYEAQKRLYDRIIAIEGEGPELASAK